MENNNYKEIDTAKLLELCGKVGVSGNEFDVSRYVKSMLKEFCCKVRSDSLCNVWGCVNSNGSKTVLLEAHLDEIGLMVSGINDDGFLEFTNIGGVDPGILPSLEVTVWGKQAISGVIGVKPPHLQQSANREVYPVEELFIDIGYNKEQAQKIISVGDTVSFVSRATDFGNGYVMSKSFDNRAGIYTVIESLRNLTEKATDSDIQYVGLASVQEEVGCRGAGLPLFADIKPNISVVIDVTHGVSPYVTKQEAVALKSGVTIDVGPNTHSGIRKKLMQALKDEKVPFDVEVSGGHSGTNAWRIQTIGSGIPVIILSIPLRYMHTCYEVLSVEDLAACINSATLFCEKTAREVLLL